MSIKIDPKFISADMADDSELATKESLSNKNQPNGYAGLDSDGKLPASVIPSDIVIDSSFDGYTKTQSDDRYEAKNTNIQSHISNTSNPHAVTKAQVGLGDVDNTSDENKPISTATQSALDLKLDVSSKATQAEAVAGTNDSNYITPLKIRNAVNAAGEPPIFAARAWVNFSGTTAGTFAGGASTVTRIAGSTIATITTTNNHGLTSGNVVRALTGVVAASYLVTVTGEKTFTITTAATTALTNASITFSFATIKGSGNVSSVAKEAVGCFWVNFSTPMPDENYIAVPSGARTASPTSTDTCAAAVDYFYQGAVRYTLEDVDGGGADYPNMGLVVFR